MSSELMFLSKLRCGVLGFFPPDSFSFIYKLEAKLQGLPASNQELEMKVRCYISIKTTVTPSKVVLSPPKVWLKFCKLIYCSIAQSYLTLHNPMDWSTPGFPVLHHLWELAQTHVHWVTDAIQPSHPLSFPLIAYSERCQICDLWGRFGFGTRDQAWSLESFCVAEFYYTEKGQRKLLTLTSEWGGRVPPSLVLEKGVIYFFNWLLQ